MKPDAANVSNDPIERRLNEIEEVLVSLSGRDLVYFCGYWDAFAKIQNSKFPKPDEEEEWKKDDLWETYLQGLEDGDGDRREYEQRVGSKP